MMTLVTFAGVTFSALLLEQALIAPILGREGKKNAIRMTVCMLPVIAAASFPLYALLQTGMDPARKGILAILLALLVGGLIQLLLWLVRPGRSRELRKVWTLTHCNCATLCCILARSGATAGLFVFTGRSVLMAVLFLILMATLSGAYERVRIAQALNAKRIPEAFQGLPLMLLTAGILCLVLGAANVAVW